MFILFAIYALCVCYAMWSDANTFRIPNIVSVILVAAFPVFALLQLDGTTAAYHLGVALIVFAGAFLLYVLGLMGAGDVKMMSAVSLWMGTGTVLEFIMLMAFLGAAMAVGILVMRRYAVVWRDWAGHWSGVARVLDIAESGKVPYGIPIGIAALWYAQKIFAI